jgi:hypothetical protein
MALVMVLALLGAVFLYWIGIDALEGRSDFQFFADSSTYHEATRGGLSHVETLTDMVGIAGNFIGPLLLLHVTGDNYYAVLALNAILLAFSVTSLARSLRLDAFKLLLVLLANPLTISSLLSVNKEIISLVFVALLVRSYVAGSLGMLVLSALVSVLVRWQLAAFLAVALAIFSRWNPLREQRLFTLLGLLVAISVLYVQLAAVLEPVRLNFEMSAADYEGSGAYQWLIDRQDSGLYWLVFPLKAAHLLFATGLRFDRLLSPNEIYNDVWQLLHSTMTLVMFIALWRARRLSLANDLVYLSLIYLVVFAITPIYTPRYFYPVYVFWAIAMVLPSDRPAAIVRSPWRGPERRPKRLSAATHRPSNAPRRSSTSAP